MGDNYKIQDPNISYVDFGQTDIFEEVTPKSQYELVEQDLREKHPNCKKHTIITQKLLKKYDFGKITKIRLTVL